MKYEINIFGTYNYNFQSIAVAVNKTEIFELFINVNFYIFFRVVKVL